MLFVDENFLQKIGITFDQFSWIWIVLMIAGAVAAGMGFNWKRKDWMEEAQKRQNARYDYTDPVLESSTPKGQLTREEKELAKQIHISRTEPTFEEWKAAREREQGKGGN